MKKSIRDYIDIEQLDEWTPEEEAKLDAVLKSGLKGEEFAEAMEKIGFVFYRNDEIEEFVNATGINELLEASKIDTDK